MKKTIQSMLKKAEKGTLKHIVLSDAKGYGDNNDALCYLKDICNYGCSGGSCANLIYYVDTHKFYNDNADEIDELLEKINDEQGAESVSAIIKNGHDLRNTLAWLAYEETARAIMQELDPEF